MRKYLVIVEKANGNYSAYSPDVPGCIATGAIREEAEKNIKEAIHFHIEGLAEDGLPIPEPSSFTEYVEVWTVSIFPRLVSNKEILSHAQR